MANTQPGIPDAVTNHPADWGKAGGLGYEEADASLPMFGATEDFGVVNGLGFEEDPGTINYDFEAAPVADPYAPANCDEIPLGLCEPVPCPFDDNAVAADPETATIDDVCNTSDFTQDANDSMSTAAEAPADISEAEEDEDAPPTPDVDYNAADLATEQGTAAAQPRDREAESAAAAEALKEMGLEIPNTKRKHKAKKCKKDRKNRARGTRDASVTSDNGDEVVVSPVRRKMSPEGEAAVVEAAAAPAPSAESKLGALPMDSAPTLVNEHELTLGSDSIEADTQSPNDVLLTFRQRLTAIEDAVQSSPKLRYTAVAASEGYLAFGMVTGGTFLFSRGDHSFQCSLPGTEGDRSVTSLAFAPDDHLLAVASESGAIHLWRGPWGHLQRKPQLLKTIVEHDGATITSMSWSSSSKDLFVGDSAGLVTRSPVLKAPMVPSASKMFPNLRVLQKVVSNVVPQTDVVHRCGCAVVQVTAGRAGVVLISSLKQTLIADPAERALWVVGKKLRYGEYGACFGPGRTFPAVFSARPGSRIWVAKSRTGYVTATISVKEHFDTPSTPILHPSGMNSATSSPSDGPQSVNFTQLIPVREKYLLSWSRDRIVLVDPGKARLIGWYKDIRGIIDVSVVNDEIFVLHEGVTAVEGADTPPQPRCTHLALLSPGETAAAMTVAGNVLDGAAMIIEYYQNATPENFLQNVQLSDLNLVQKQLADVPDVDPKLTNRIAELAALAAELRKEEENRMVADAEQMFMASLGVHSVVVDAEASGGSDDVDFTSSLPGMSPAPPRTPLSTANSLQGDENEASESPCTTPHEDSDIGEGLNNPIVA
mmetsp:Transcript_21511/g.63988  ORF Transcript_21511/g.63988 Transcript_21511/m.63988 type:complete len:824 (+) Transcript_21511:98-2569(+)